MIIPTLEGITAKTITTGRITTRVLFSGDENGFPVLFLHGNTSSATWWEEALVDLPAGYRGIAPDQRGFGDADPTKKINATNGMGDLADDAIALLDHLGIEKTHVVGNSMGGSVVWWLLAKYAGRLAGVTLVSPGSPYGFGATKGLDGEPCNPDFAGSGGGLSNPELIKRLVEGDRSTDSPFSPRSAIRTIIVKPPYIPPREEELLSSMLATHMGSQDVPGDTTQSAHWPHMAPGVWGPANGLSPKYALNVQEIIHSEPKQNILWVRGSHDLAVSDAALSCPGNLGKLGLLPGWPGDDTYPPQPMVGQTRAVLEKYAVAGGGFDEVVIPDTGHVPFIEKPAEFNRVLHAHLKNS